MEAIILAGGLGTRLSSVVKDKPKALSVVAGRPFLSFVIEDLLRKGVEHFIFAIGHLSDQIIEYLKNDYPQLTHSISVEDKPLGTGGAIKKALQHSKAQNVFIVNADTFFDVDLKAMHSAHENAGADCTIAVKQMFDFNRYGVVELGNDNRISAFKEKEFRQEGLINGGLYLLKKQVFMAESFPEVFSLEKEFLEKKADLKLYGFISEGYFIDIGIPADYETAQLTFANFNQAK